MAATQYAKVVREQPLSSFSRKDQCFLTRLSCSSSNPSLIVLAKSMCPKYTPSATSPGVYTNDMEIVLLGIKPYKPPRDHSRDSQQEPPSPPHANLRELQGSPANDKSMPLSASFTLQKNNRTIRIIYTIFIFMHAHTRSGRPTQLKQQPAAIFLLLFLRGITTQTLYGNIES